MSNSDNMKLIIIVVNDTESENLLKALLEEDFRVTRSCLHRRFYEARQFHLVDGC